MFKINKKQTLKCIVLLLVFLMVPGLNSGIMAAEGNSVRPNFVTLFLPNATGTRSATTTGWFVMEILSTSDAICHN